MKKHWIGVSIVAFLAIYTIIFGYNIITDKHQNERLISDVGRLIPVEVRKIIRTKEEEQLIEIIKEAKEAGLKVSIAGAKHSQGGHAVYPDSVHLDMTSFNRILEVNPESKTIRVQSGATWKQVQEAANPYGLAVMVMQSSNIFTVGGSLSVNAHGRDVRYGPIIETVNSFRLLTAEGEIVNVSREEHPELFYAAIGGYGLFGVILDAEIQLTDDVVYENTNHPMDYRDYPAFFKAHVLDNPNVHLHIARLSTAPSVFLTEMYASNFTLVDDSPDHRLADDSGELVEETNIRRNKFIFGLARRWDWGKELFWNIQKRLYAPDNLVYVNRNNAMRPEIHFLEYESDRDTDLLQEFFVPADAFVPFIDRIRTILETDGVNLLNITIRYVPQNEEAMLSYARSNMLAVVLLINQGLSEQDRNDTVQTVQRLVDAALDVGGTYYLPYAPYPAKEQFRSSYPNADAFMMLKQKADPTGMFMNHFYERYFLNE